MASTKHDTAYWEVQETRKITASTEPPHQVIIKMSRAHWGCFDFLVNTVGYHPSRLVDLVEEEARHAGKKFHDIFPCCIVHLDRAFSEHHYDDYGDE